MGGAPTKTMGKISRRNKTHTCTRKSTSRGIPNYTKPSAVVSGEVSDRWDPKHTLTTNYTKMGLVSNLKSLKVTRQVHKRVIVNPIEFQVGEAVPNKERKGCSEGEAEVVANLIQKHGENYKAMERDHKINTHQHTASQLRKKVERYRRQLARKESQE